MLNSNCRVCGSNKVNIFFKKENCFFWYGPENEYLKKNLHPKQMDVSMYLCLNCGFIGLVVNEQLKKIAQMFYSSPTSIPGTTHGQNSNYSIKLTKDFFDNYNKLLHNCIPDSVLEIGCQSGYLLHRFELMGTKTVIGIEPGNIEPYKDEKGEKVDVRRGCLSREIVDKSDFDLIICLFVLEHVEDVNSFLSIVYELLSKKGKLLLSVPNEFFALRDGNIGLLNMQHFNYFTPDSLINLLKKNGLNVLDSISTRASGLYILAEKNNEKFNDVAIANDKLEKYQDMVKSYSSLVEININKIKQLLHDPSNIIGLYGVNCSLPNIFSWISELNERKVYIFDSDSLKWDKYFSGVPNKIYPPQKMNLANKVVIVPYRLQEEIYSFLLEKKYSTLEIIKLYD